MNNEQLRATNASLVAALEAVTALKEQWHKRVAYYESQHKSYDYSNNEGIAEAISECIGEVTAALAAAACEPSEPEGTTLSLAHIDKAAEAMGVTRKQLDDLISPTTPSEGAAILVDDDGSEYYSENQHGKPAPDCTLSNGSRHVCIFGQDNSVCEVHSGVFFPISDGAAESDVKS